MTETPAPTTPAPAPPRPGAGWRRWWVYQRERFPLAQHGPLILVFAASAVCYSHLLRGRSDWPRPAALIVAFVTCLAFFLQLRIADEFKDFQEDARYRPYRPVPRGLVTRRGLAVLFVLAAAVQLGLALGLRPALLVLLLIAWAYLVAMSKEFLVRDWLKARPIVYMGSHMFIMPLVNLYATGCDWLGDGAALPRGLLWFLAASYCNGLVIEIGRKVRVPADEEVGVPTYSALWGRDRAIAAWLGVMAATAVFAALAAWRAGVLPAAMVVVVLWLVAVLVARRFLGAVARGGGKRIEVMSGLWTLGLYLALGLGPMAGQWWRHLHP